MTSTTKTAEPIQIPKLPGTGSVNGFIQFLVDNPDTPIGEIVKPYKEFESELRKVYAKEPKHEVLKDGKVNLVPIFAGQEQNLKIQARDLDTETEDQKSKYILPLNEEDRKKNGSPAVVPSLKAFQQNFNLFSESSLTELDWSNVVAAGSSVTTALLPVPEKWAGSKRKLREYYHEHLAPASDVDLFLYGLNEEEAIEKIKQIEKNVKDSILHETTTIRTKNAITIASQYPTRHVQIVLRLYDSISQIITGFDVDCACAAYDGEQVYAAPRALASFITQTNEIDLSRRSPSYENRLSKYSHRGFEVHWPALDRTRIDPTIFERSFGRTLGLARLLILEKLPKSVDRESYMDKRRSERGRPAVSRSWRNQYRTTGNLKEREEDEVADWVDEEEIASYHTMNVPYGPKYTSQKIDRLLYAKDLLLNAEWNQQKDRPVNLHRHPCFLGTAEEVLQDCCGYCPVPKTDEEIDISEEESRTMVSGSLKFVTEDPGRQAIGSFNPITDDEWTSMAYVGDTARLCQAIVDGDLEHVQDWCSQDGVDVDRRDYTGRTPLILACMTSTPEIVKCLIDHGARLIARLVDGRTALHIAAARGEIEMVKALMNRSLENEEAEDEKEDVRKAARKAARLTSTDAEAAEDVKECVEDDKDESNSEASEVTLESEEGSDSMTMGSFVKIDNGKPSEEEIALDSSTEGPDFYDVNVVAWDYGLTPLHLAILNGHHDTIDLLVSEYGADVLLPVKLVEPGSTTPKGAIMCILLALVLPSERTKKIVKQLLALGATSSQGDMNRISVLHYIAAVGNTEVFDMLLENDRPVAMSVLENLGSEGNHYHATYSSPLTTAIEKGHKEIVSRLLDLGAKTTIEFDNWVKVYLAKNDWAKNHDSETNKERYLESVSQPIVRAVTTEKGSAEVVISLLKHGADPLTLEPTAHAVLKNPQSASYNAAESVLDIVQKKLGNLQKYKNEGHIKEPEKLRSESFYTSGLRKGTYEYWSALKSFEDANERNKNAWESYNKNFEGERGDQLKRKKESIAAMIKEMEKAEKALLKAGAKTFTKLHPDIATYEDRYHNRWNAPERANYETSLKIMLPDLNDAKRHAYISLFEAAWNDDLDKIKSLTLAPWDSPPLLAQTPLKIAVQDNNGFSPFSIAVLRGHYDLAKKIIEICITQYQKDGELSRRQKYNLRMVNEETYSEYDSEYDDQDEHEHLPIISELVNETFTVDNLGEVASIVKSDVLPLTMIEWTCPTQRFQESTNEKVPNCHRSLLEHAVATDDIEMFRFILRLGAEHQSLLAEGEDDQRCYKVGQNVFHVAIQHGRITMLGELIKETGVGLPLDSLIQKSGIEIKSKPKYYQGLSVGGKKRADWAQAPGGLATVVDESVPPLLQSAHTGSLDSIEWFMSDAPLRRYKEFAETNKNDKRIKSLKESGDQFESVVGKWLNYKSDLLLHSAILWNFPDSTGSEGYIALIKHLTANMPELLEKHSSEGWTPLQLAVLRHRPTVVKHLISIGVNQRCRDKQGRNAVHSMAGYREANTNVEFLKDIIQYFNKESLKEMLVERTLTINGALTPVAFWMATNNGKYKKSDFIDVLQSYSDGKNLEMINGEGDLPLHVAVRQNLGTITSYLLSQNAQLLYRENATGRTPLEMAHETYIASQVTSPPSVAPSYWDRYRPGGTDYDSITSKDPSTFGEEKMEESQKKVWEICHAVDEGLEKEGKSGKRRLVSLFEANEVAKRLTGLKKVQRRFVANGGEADKEVKEDFISDWL